MARPPQLIIKLTEAERIELTRGSRAGDWKARKVRRARILLLTDVSSGAQKKRLSDVKIAEQTGCSKGSVWRLRSRFQKERLGALDEKPRTGRPKVIDGELEAKMIAIACSEAPEGRERWTLRLIAKKLVCLTEELESLSYTTVGKALKKTNSSRG